MSRFRLAAFAALAFIAPLAAHAADAPAPFAFIDTFDVEGNQVFAYSQLPSGPQKSQMVAQVMMVPPASYSFAGRSKVVLSTLQTFDCAGRRYRVDQAGYVDETGAPVGKGISDTEWNSLEEGSTAKLAFELVCGLTPPPAETLADLPAVQADAYRRAATPSATAS